MSPEKAKVFIAEDDNYWQESFRTEMVRGGHEVVLEVDNIQDGLAAVTKAKELGVDVALVDGCIPMDREDGTILARTLREAIPGIKVVDVSTFGNAVGRADAQMAKRDFKLDGLGELVRGL